MITKQQTRSDILRRLARESLQRHLDSGELAAVRDVYQRAIEDPDVDVVVVLARRAIVLFRLLTLAGMLHPSLRDVSGRVCSQRRAERIAKESGLEGLRIAILDEWVQTGTTMEKYADRFLDLGAQSIQIFAAGASSKAIARLSKYGNLVIGNLKKNKDFGPSISRASLDSSLFYFVDFPVFRVAPHALSIALFLNWLSHNGWSISQLHCGSEASSVRHYVLRESTDPSRRDFRLRLQLVLDEEGTVLDAQILAKVSSASETHRIDDYSSRVEAELAYRHDAYYESMARFAELLNSVPAVARALNPALEGQALVDNWTDYQQRIIQADWRDLLDAAVVHEVDEAIKEEIRVFVSGDSDTAVFEPRLSTIGTKEQRAEILLDIGRHSNGVTWEELVNKSSLGTLESLELLDQLHDEGIIVSRFRDCNGIVERLWFKGENGKRKALVATHCNEPFVIDGRTDISFDKAHFTEVPSGKKFEVLVGDIFAFCDRDNQWHALKEQYDSEHGAVIRKVAAMLPIDIRHTGRLHPWMEEQRAALGGSSVYRVVKDGRGDVALAFASCVTA